MEKKQTRRSYTLSLGRIARVELAESDEYYRLKEEDNYVDRTLFQIIFGIKPEIKKSIVIVNNEGCRVLFYDNYLSTSCAIDKIKSRIEVDVNKSEKYNLLIMDPLDHKFFMKPVFRIHDFEDKIILEEYVDFDEALLVKTKIENSLNASNISSVAPPLVVSFDFSL